MARKSGQRQATKSAATKATGTQATRTQATRTQATRTQATRTQATRTQATRTQATRTQATRTEAASTEAASKATALKAMSEWFDARSRALDEQALDLPPVHPALEDGPERAWLDSETGEPEIRWRPNLAETSINAGFGECWKLLVGAREALGDDPCIDARREAEATARLLEEAAAETDDEHARGLILLAAEDTRQSVFPRAPQRDPLELLRELWERLGDLEEEVMGRLRIVSGREALARLRPNPGGPNKRNSPLRTLLTFVLTRKGRVQSVSDLWSLLLGRAEWDELPELPAPWSGPADVKVSLYAIKIDVKGCKPYEHDRHAVERLARKTFLLVEPRNEDKVTTNKNA